MKGIYDEWHKVAQFITGKNVIHQSYSTIDEAKRALEESSKKKNQLKIHSKIVYFLAGEEVCNQRLK